MVWVGQLASKVFTLKTESWVLLAQQTSFFKVIHKFYNLPGMDINYLKLKSLGKNRLVVQLSEKEITGNVAQMG